MADRTLKRYTAGEEIFNSVSHGVGSLLAIGGTALMTVMSVAHGSGLALSASLIYGISLIVLYTMSTVYHAVANPKAKEILRIFDHTSIFLLIAGSYTPFCLVALAGNSRGLAVIIAVWACAILGIVLNAIDLKKDREVWYGTLCHHGMVDFGCVQGHHPCSAGTGILAASHRRHQLYRRFGILRLEERKIHAQHLAFICPGGQRAPLSVHFHLRFAYGLLILPTK